MTLEQTKLNNLLSSGGGGGRGNNKNTETQNKTLAPRESVLLPLDPQMVSIGVSWIKPYRFLWARWWNFSNINKQSLHEEKCFFQISLLLNFKLFLIPTLYSGSVPVLPNINVAIFLYFLRYRVFNIAYRKLSAEFKTQMIKHPLTHRHLQNTFYKEHAPLRQN